MEAWPAPEVPDLPGRGPAVRVHDSATAALRTLTPGPVARMYVCGITPYDATHLGHAATYVAFDQLHRVWRDAGHDVAYVQNVTDVDDPLLERAAATNIAWTELAERETALFRRDMTALRVLPPRHLVGAVEALPVIGAMIERLRERGAAYDLEGDLYFPVGADPAFGTVSHLDPDTMAELAAQRGGDPERVGKKDPLDPQLWRGPRAGEPAWDGPAGPGRPGWHVECAAIAVLHLGTDFDVQGGGSDLAFPHHELSASHARVATGAPFAQAYVHAGMVGLDGEKMSKSRGNLVLVSRLLADGVDPMALRLALLAHHYRSDWEWTPGDLEAAIARLGRWRAAAAHPVEDRDADAAGGADDAVLAAVRERLADDLDAPGALDVLDRWAAAAPGSGRGAGASVARAVDALLGVSL